MSFAEWLTFYNIRYFCKYQLLASKNIISVLEIVITHSVLQTKDENALERMTTYEEDTLNYRYYNQQI